MFHSFTTSSPLSDGSRHHPLFPSTVTVAAPPRGQLLSDTNGFVGPLPSSSAPYASSLPSEYFLPRSSSAHSLLHHHHHHIPDSTNAPQPPPPPPPPPPYSPSRSSSSCDYLDFNASPMRRVLSAGDIQVTQRVGRYSTEERKERIERYRSKRNHRNFHKKITYACRKTLADSRPRTRGRFARNGETETAAAAAAAAANGVECFGYDNHDQNQGFDVLDDGNGGGDWRSQLQAALVAEVDEPGSCYDEDLLASFADVISMNILS